MSDSDENEEYFFRYDCTYRETISECNFNPTDISQDKTYWLWALNTKYDNVETDSKKTGKWMLFVSREKVNEIWNKIKEAIKTGDLWHSKVSTTKPKPLESRYAIMIYTKDYNDVDDVIQVLDYLESSSIKPTNKVIYYKTDEQTRAGVYKGGKQRPHIYSSDTIKFRRKPHGNPKGFKPPSRAPEGILSWRNRDGGSSSQT